MQITVQVELYHPSHRKRGLFRIMQAEAARVANGLVHAWAHGAPLKVTTAEVDAALPSALTNQVIRQAKAAYRASRKSGGQPPQFRSTMGLCYNNQNWRVVERDGQFKVSFPVWRNGRCERLALPVVVTEHNRGLLVDLAAGAVKSGTATLCGKRGRWFLHLAVYVPVPAPRFEGDHTPIGVDLGLRHIAVVTEPVSGRRLFFSGRAMGHWRRFYHRLRKRIQRAKNLRAVKRLGSKEARVVRDMNHKISRALVDFAVRFPNPVLRMEDLSGIRARCRSTKRADRTVHSWPFHQLQRFITYKAELCGIPVKLVDPAHTSKTCCKCGRSGRREGVRFRCGCGYAAHADLNAARNIAARPARGQPAPEKGAA